MLEFALKKERIKVTQMKGEDGGNIPNPPELDGNDSPTDEIPVSYINRFGIEWKNVFSRKWQAIKKAWAISGLAADSSFVNISKKSASQIRFSTLEVHDSERFLGIQRPTTVFSLVFDKLVFHKQN